MIAGIAKMGIMSRTVLAGIVQPLLKDVQFVNQGQCVQCVMEPTRSQAHLAQ